MIKAILVFNNHGKPRLTKFYEFYVRETICLAIAVKLIVNISPPPLSNFSPKTCSSK